MNRSAIVTFCEKSWKGKSDSPGSAVMKYSFLWGMALVICGGCVGPTKSFYPPAAGEIPRTVYFVNHGGLHTGLAVARADIPTNVWPANFDYPDAKYLEVGWGDDEGYRKDLTTRIVVKALVY